MLRYVLIAALKLLHPFMPFITEEIYVSILRAGESIMISSWPEAKAEYDFEAEAADMAGVMEAIRSIRNTRAEMDVPAARKAKLIVRTERAGLIREAQEYLKRLASGAEVEVIPVDAPEIENAASCVVAIGEIFMPLGDLVDAEKELARLAKERENIAAEIRRAEGKLGNEKFVAKAPKNVVEEERAKLEKYPEMLQKLESRIQAVEKLL